MMRVWERGDWAPVPLPLRLPAAGGPVPEGRIAVVRDEALIGCIGTIVVPTRGQAGPGEVVVSVRGGREALIAWSAEPLPRGSSVLVIESRGHRAVDVSPWADPFSDPFEDFPGRAPG